MVGYKQGEENVETYVNEDDVMRLAETTEVSPQQARELLRQFSGDYELAKKQAKNFKAES